MIVEPPRRPARADRPGANRELAIGLVAVALLSALLVHYALGFACRTRTGWPCRPSDLTEAGTTPAVVPTPPLGGPMAVPPFATPVVPQVFTPPALPTEALPPTEAAIASPTVPAIRPATVGLPTAVIPSPAPASSPTAPVLPGPLPTIELPTAPSGYPGVGTGGGIAYP